MEDGAKMETEAKKEHNACLICKHAFGTRLNIFKTRTNFSKTLVSCKLSRLVQTVFKPGDDQGENPQDICGSCASLINQVDECEIKLMALENEVHSRRTDNQPGSDEPANKPAPEGEGGEVAVQEQPAEDVVQEHAPLVQGVAQSADGSQQFSFISLDGASIGENTIVLQTEDVDGENVVVYREPYGDHVSYGTSIPSMSYLTQLETHEASMDDEQDMTQEDYDTEDGIDMVELHKASHEAEKNFQCRFCQEEFLTNMALHNHLNENHPLKLLPCPYCDKRFLNKSNLNQHVNTHQEPRFRCEQCPRQFHTRGDLRKHIVFRHTQEKNYQCPDCDQCFKVNWLLNRHKVRCHAA